MRRRVQTFDWYCTLIGLLVGLRLAEVCRWHAVKIWSKMNTDYGSVEFTPQHVSYVSRACDV